jgi:ribonuclease E
MGKISPFGLMEISRQRRRSGVLEGTTHVCEHCQGTGRIRSVESSALAALRAIEVEAARGGAGAVTVRLTTAIALYILNEKRNYLARLEQTHDLIVTIATDDHLGHTDIDIERTEAREPSPDRKLDIQPAGRGRVFEPEPEPEVEDEIEADDEAEDEDEAVEADDARRDDTPEEADARRRRRRRRRGGRRDERDERGPRAPLETAHEADDEDDGEETGGEDGGDETGTEAEREARRKRRRRGRRGGRRVRDDGRPLDAYAWVHAHPSRRPNPSEDPYAWRDPHAPTATREDRSIEARAERIIAPVAAPSAASVTAPLPGPQTVVEAGGDADPYVWAAASEEGAEEVVTGRRRERVRRGRGRRGRGTDRSPADADIALADEDGESPAPEVQAPEPPPAAVELSPEAEASVELAPEPVVEAPAPPVAAVVEPQPEPEPDPNEITTPPATPRRGWWRRGG